MNLDIQITFLSLNGIAILQVVLFVIDFHFFNYF